MSPRFSFKGWSLATWIAKNKERIKTIVSTAGGVGVAYLSGFDKIGLGLGAVGALFLGLILDALDYYLTEQ